MKIRAFFILLITLVLAGCETTVSFTDPQGNEVKMSETAYMTMVTAEAVEKMGTPVDPCKPNLGVSYAELSASGQEALGRAFEMCNIRMMMATAMGKESSAQGQMFAANTKLGIAVEQGQSSKVRSMFGFGTAGLGFYFGYKAIDSLASQAGDTYGDVNVQASNSGDATGGGEGSAGLSGHQERNMHVQIGGGGASTIQSGTSNTQASGSKAQAADNPIVNGGPDNSIFTDNDGNNNDSRLF